MLIVGKGEGKGAGRTSAGDRAQMRCRLAIECERGVGSRSDAGEASGGDRVRAECWQLLRCELDADGYSSEGEIRTASWVRTEHRLENGPKTCCQQPLGRMRDVDSCSGASKVSTSYSGACGAHEIV